MNVVSSHRKKNSFLVPHLISSCEFSLQNLEPQTPFSMRQGLQNRALSGGMRALLSWFSHFISTPFPNTLILAIRFQHIHSGVHISITILWEYLEACLKSGPSHSNNTERQMLSKHFTRVKFLMLETKAANRKDFFFLSYFMLASYKEIFCFEFLTWCNCSVNRYGHWEILLYKGVFKFLFFTIFVLWNLN